MCCLFGFSLGTTNYLAFMLDWPRSFLYIFDPNIIAHSQLVTNDIYVTGMIFFLVIGYGNFLEIEPSKIF